MTGADIHAAIVRCAKELAEDYPRDTLAQLVPSLSVLFAEALGMKRLVGDQAHDARTSPRMRLVDMRMVVHGVLEGELASSEVPPLMGKIEAALAEFEKQKRRIK